jgi:hypothetical protein
MRLAVIGSRTFGDFELLSKSLDEFNDHSKITLIVSGGARGADSLAERYAKERGIEVKVFLPDWERFGKSAGFRRNHDIIAECDACIAFWDGSSKGTLSSIELARKKGARVEIIKF